MKMTSAQAAKLLRQWNESLKALQRREENTKTFPQAETYVKCIQHNHSHSGI